MSDFESYAEQIGLDLEQFRSDINSDDVVSAVNDGYGSAVANGINSTPTFS